ncbi:MAG: hypothetical protein ABRQ39_09580 [Candidatus Eremiobacterota bacterium]
MEIIQKSYNEIIRRRKKSNNRLIMMEKEENEINLEELYNNGKIIPYQAIYDISFKPVFKIKYKLGYIADQLKRYYSETEIQKDPKINNEERIVFIRNNIQTIFSFTYLRVIEQFPDSKDFNLNKIKGEVSNFRSKVKAYLENTEIPRIGVRFQYFGSLDKINKIKELNKIAIFKDLLKTVDRENDKIFSFKFHVFPDPMTEETVIQLLGGNNYEYELKEKKYKFEKAVLIDCIKGYFNPKSIELDYLTQTHKYIQEKVLNNLMEIREGE